MIKFLHRHDTCRHRGEPRHGPLHLVKDEGQSKRMVNALTVRIALSVLLFILLFVAWKGGMIQPHGVGRYGRG